MKAQHKTNDDKTHNGMTVTENGNLYYIFGNIRIKITEHFPASGKAIDELLADYIQKKIKEKTS